MRKLIAFIIVISIVHIGIAQTNREKVYFDKFGKSSNQNEAYYFRQQTDTLGYYRSFFISNGTVSFTGKLLVVNNEDDTKSTYSGTCIWNYKNGANKQIRHFGDKGIETGVSKYFYESGKIWKELEFVNGKLKNHTYVEYEEDGVQNKIFEEDFNDNENEWDVYLSDKSSSSIHDGIFELASNNLEGTSRYINYPMNSSSYAIEAVVSFSALKNLKDNDKIGLIYGFKDWQNYHYFVITKKNIFVGSVFEGLISVDVDGMFCSSINPADKNTLKIISNGEKSYFSVNGQVQYSDDANKLFRSNFGFIVSGKASLKAEKLIIKEIDSKSGKIDNAPSDANVKATGSGIIVSTNGHIITNHHVIDNASKFQIEINTSIGKISYNAELLQSDKENDLAILKIKDDNFKNFEKLNYAFKENGGVEVGASVFTIGYPYALSGMGKDAKFTDGKISSKTGYNGVINSFQSTIPVQPGNSGGPVFNEKGQLIGVINSGIREADNVSYAIKLNYINNLIDLLSDNIERPSDNSINSLSLEEKIKVLTNYVVLIKVR